MPIKIECPQCDRDYRLPDESAGRRFRCKNCSTMLSVPDADDDFDDVSDDDDEDDAPRRVRKKQNPRKGARRKPASDSSKGMVQLAIVLAGIFAFFGMCLAIFLAVAFQGRNPAPQVTHGSPLPVTEAPVPTFPDLGTARILQPSGVRMYFVQMPGSSIPGHSMAMRLYLPPADGPPQSIPCVLVAPAGTNLLRGNDMDADDYHAETLPYAEAGMAVVFYSLDGGMADSENATDGQFADAYKRFRAAAGGVINARNALEFVLAKAPQVNPALIFAAGHSSAGTVSLLLAGNEERLAGCLAYAPCTDVEARLGPVLQDIAVQQLLPGVKDFIKQTSPRNQVDNLHCPIFLFHADDDSNVNVSESRNYARQLNDAGVDVEFVTVPTGEHYQSMIQDGVPRGIQWINKQIASYKENQ